MRLVFGLLGLALVCDCGLGCCDGLGISKISVGDGLEVLVELIHERYSRGDVEVEDVLVGDGVEILHQCAEGVSVCCDDDVLSGLDLGCDDLVPVGDDPVDGDLEGFGRGKVLLVDSLVHLLVSGVALVGLLEVGWADVEGTSPDLDLGVSILCCGLGLVESLKCSIVALVELPCLHHGDVVLVHSVEDVVESVDCPLEIGREGDVEGESLLLEEKTGVGGLLVSLLG